MGVVSLAACSAVRFGMWLFGHIHRIIVRKPMTITLPLEPQKEAQLLALARERGVSPDELVRQAIDQILAAPLGLTKARKSAYGLLARYGPGPTDAEIDENRKEMFQGFAEDRP